MDGSRVSKADPRMAAIGDVDEANSALGVAIAALGVREPASLLQSVQNDLFDLGADLATPWTEGEENGAALRVTAAQVARVERMIDALNQRLAPLTSFILPGGDSAAAALHFARAVTRRAERSVVSLLETVPVRPEVVAYLNRLSDLLFVAARVVNQNGAGDVLWVPGASRADA